MNRMSISGSGDLKFWSGTNMIPVEMPGVRSPHASVLVIYHTIHQTRMPSLLSTTPGIPAASESTLEKPAEWSVWITSNIYCNNCNHPTDAIKRWYGLSIKG